MNVEAIHRIFDQRIEWSEAVSLRRIKSGEIVAQIGTQLALSHGPSNETKWTTLRSICHLVDIFYTFGNFLKFVRVVWDLASSGFDLM